MAREMLVQCCTVRAFALDVLLDIGASTLTRWKVKTVLVFELLDGAWTRYEITTPWDGSVRKVGVVLHPSRCSVNAPHRTNQSIVGYGRDRPIQRLGGDAALEGRIDE